MGRINRGLALMLVLLGATFVGSGPFLADFTGPAKSSFEALARYDRAISAGADAAALAPGLEAARLAAIDPRWSDLDRARYALALADLELRLGRRAQAALAAETAAARLIYDAGITVAGLIAAADHGARIALDGGDQLGAACTFGLALERLGTERVARPGALAQPDLLWLHRRLLDLSPRFSPGSESHASFNASRSLTSCQHLADFYAGAGALDAAASVSGLIIDAAREDEDIGVEVRAALLRYGAQILEQAGDIPLAEARLKEAVHLLEARGHPDALEVAKEDLGSFATRYGTAVDGEALIREVIASRTSRVGADDVSLVRPLIDLGLARFDADDRQGTEATLLKALEIARVSRTGRPQGKEIENEALTALAAVYEETGRVDEAASLRALVGAHIADAADSLRASRARQALFEIPVTASARPWSGLSAAAFTDPAAGLVRARTRVALPIGAQDGWADLWDDEVIMPTSEELLAPAVSAPEPATAIDVPMAMHRVLLIAGAGRTFDESAIEAAALQARLGPLFEVALHVAVAGASPNRFFDHPRSQDRAAKDLAHEIARLAKADGRLDVIADGRGARLFALALGAAPAATPGFPENRDLGVTLVAPDLSAEEFRGLIASLEAHGAQVRLFASAGVHALHAAQELEGRQPVGASAMRLAELSGLEAHSVDLDANEPAASPLSLPLIARIAEEIGQTPEAP